MEGEDGLVEDSRHRMEGEDGLAKDSRQDGRGGRYGRRIKTWAVYPIHKM